MLFTLIEWRIFSFVWHLPTAVARALWQGGGGLVEDKISRQNGRDHNKFSYNTGVVILLFLYFHILIGNTNMLQLFKIFSCVRWYLLSFFVTESKISRHSPFFFLRDDFRGGVTPPSPTSSNGSAFVISTLPQCIRKIR